MTVNISAITALFPPKTTARTSTVSGTDPLTIQGPFPYDAIMAAGLSNPLAPIFIGAIESVRADPHWGPIYRGDLSVHGNDHSAADLAMCGEFARLGLPGPMIDTAMRTSGLYRGKWERDDYRSRTIGLALGGKSNPASSGLLAPENGRVDAGSTPPPPRDWLVHSITQLVKAGRIAFKPVWPIGKCLKALPAQPVVAPVLSEAIQCDVVRFSIPGEECFAGTCQAIDERQFPRVCCFRPVEPIVEVVEVFIFAMSIFIAPDSWVSWGRCHLDHAATRSTMASARFFWV